MGFYPKKEYWLKEYEGNISETVRLHSIAITNPTKIWGIGWDSSYNIFALYELLFTESGTRWDYKTTTTFTNTDEKILSCNDGTIIYKSSKRIHRYLKDKNTWQEIPNSTNTADFALASNKCLFTLTYNGAINQYIGEGEFQPIQINYPEGTEENHKLKLDTESKISCWEDGTIMGIDYRKRLFRLYLWKGQYYYQAIKLNSRMKVLQVTMVASDKAYLVYSEYDAATGDQKPPNVCAYPGDYFDLSLNQSPVNYYAEQSWQQINLRNCNIKGINSVGDGSCYLSLEIPNDPNIIGPNEFSIYKNYRGMFNPVTVTVQPPLS